MRAQGLSLLVPKAWRDLCSKGLGFSVQHDLVEVGIHNPAIFPSTRWQEPAEA